MKTEKLCSKCDEVKPADAFYKDASKGKEYLSSMCKACKLASSKEYYRAHKEERQEYARNHNPARRENYHKRMKQQREAYYIAHREQYGW